MKLKGFPFLTMSLIVQPMSMVLPGVVGFKMTGKLRDGVTATDLVLTATQMLRKHGVVGKFVEFHGKFIFSYLWRGYYYLKRLKKARRLIFMYLLLFTYR